MEIGRWQQLSTHHFEFKGMWEPYEALIIDALYPFTTNTMPTTFYYTGVSPRISPNRNPGIRDKCRKFAISAPRSTIG